MGHVEPEPQRQQMMPRLPAQAPAYSQPAFNSSYMGPPAMTSYYPTMQPTPPPQQQVSGLYYQRPLPQVSIEFSEETHQRTMNLTIPQDLPSHVTWDDDAII